MLFLNFLSGIFLLSSTVVLAAPITQGDLLRLKLKWFESVLIQKHWDVVPSGGRTELPEEIDLQWLITDLEQEAQDLHANQQLENHFLVKPFSGFYFQVRQLSREYGLGAALVYALVSASSYTTAALFAASGSVALAAAISAAPLGSSTTATYLLLRQLLLVIQKSKQYGSYKNWVQFKRKMRHTQKALGTATGTLLLPLGLSETGVQYLRIDASTDLAQNALRSLGLVREMGLRWQQVRRIVPDHVVPPPRLPKWERTLWGLAHPGIDVRLDSVVANGLQASDRLQKISTAFPAALQSVTYGWTGTDFKQSAQVISWLDSLRERPLHCVELRNFIQAYPQGMSPLGWVYFWKHGLIPLLVKKAKGFRLKPVRALKKYIESIEAQMVRTDQYQWNDIWDQSTRHGLLDLFTCGGH